MKATVKERDLHRVCVAFRMLLPVCCLPVWHIPVWYCCILFVASGIRFFKAIDSNLLTLFPTVATNVAWANVLTPLGAEPWHEPLGSSCGGAAELFRAASMQLQLVNSSVVK